MSVLGPRAWYQYKSDTGVSYNQYMRHADALAVGNNPTTLGQYPAIPSRLRRRHVWFVNSAGLLRRKIYIDSTTNTCYSSPQTITLDGDTWTNEGRVGEKTLGTVVL